MAHFDSYNTSDASTGNQPLGAGGIVTIGPVQSGIASRIAGSYFSDQSGTLLVQQSFDGVNWDIQTSYALTANAINAGIDQDVIAPFLRFKYTNGGTPQGVLRIFIRVFGGGEKS